MAPDPFRLLTLGSASLVDADGKDCALSIGKPFALLAYLLHADEPVPRDRLASVFWPGATRERARGSLRHALWALRQAVADDLFEGEDPISVRGGRVASDLAELKEALGAGRLDDADALWDGPPLEGVVISDAPEWERWVEEVRREVEQRFAQALADAGRREREGGRGAEALPFLEKARGIQPYSLRNHLELIEALLDLRRFDDAAEALLDARGQLDDPDAESRLDALEERLLTLKRGQPLQEGARTRPRLGFVGRTEEFSSLVLRWRRAREGKASVGLITGEPGIGKTRLAEEVALLAKAEGGRVIHLHVEDGERPIEWGLLGELVRRLLQLSGAAGISQASDEVLRELAPSLSSGNPEAGRAGRGASPAARPSAALADALQDLLNAVSEDAPLLLVIDDLQWADSESRALLGRVSTRLDRAAVLLLVTSRSNPEGAGAQKTLTLLAESPKTTRIELRPWSRSEVAAVLTRTARFSLPAAGDGIIDRVFRTSRGNPHFVSELLETLRGEKVLEEEARGSWVLHTERVPDALPFPDSLSDLIEWQLTRLSTAALQVAETLAEAGKPANSDDLALASAHAPGTVRAGLEELDGRRLLRELSDGRVDFAHEELRDMVLARRSKERADPASAARSPRLPSTVAGIAAGIAALVLLGTGAFLFGGTREVPPPPLGGGALYLVTADSVFMARNDSNGPGGWSFAAIEGWAPNGPGLRGPYRLTDGSLRWFRQRGSEEAPAGIEDLGARGRGSFTSHRLRNEALGAPSPDGRYLLFTADHPRVARARQDIWLSARDGSNARRIYRGAGRLAGGEWSPDGRRIAFAARGVERDTLIVLAPDGSRIAAETFDEFLDLSWCGTGRELAISAYDNGETRVHLWQPRRGEVQTLPTVGLVGRQLACSPDGSSVAYHAAVEGTVTLQVLDLSSGESSAMGLGRAGQIRQLRWVPQRLDPVPVGVQILGERVVRLSWGTRHPLSADVLHSDGAGRSGPLAWTSRDPTIASVSADGVLTANRAGSTTVLARFDGWLVDSIPVLVEGDAHPETLLRDDFAILDRRRWSRIGSAPMADKLEGEPVLRFSDGRGTRIGIVSRAEFPLRQGGTLEGEMLLDLSFQEGQDLALCLLDADPPGAEATVPAHEELAGWQVRQQLCFRYPHGGVARMNPAVADLHSHPGFPPARASVSPHLPTSSWFHVALTLRPDGTGTFYVNREPIGTTATRARNGAEVRWRVGIFGVSDESESFVRSVALWPGLRY